MMNRWTSVWRARRWALGIVSCTITLICCIPNQSFGQRLYWLGGLAEDNVFSVAYGVSNEGIVVGVSDDREGRRCAFYWRLSEPIMQPLSDKGVAFAVAGESVVGYHLNGGSGFGHSAAFWDIAAGNFCFIPNASTDGAAHDISVSGEIVGYVVTENEMKAFRAELWGCENPVYLPHLSGYTRCYAQAVADYAHVYVGNCFDNNSYKAVRWVGDGAPQDLGAWDTFGVSGDGSVIVGRSNFQAARWQDNTLELLGVIGGYETSTAFSVSADGEVIVGALKGRADGQGPDQVAMVWTRETGMLNLNEVFPYLLEAGEYLEIAYDISPDGRFIVGAGFRPNQVEAFLLDLECEPNNGDIDRNGCVDDADLLQVLFGFGRSGRFLGPVDTNCDRVVDDADLLTVLFNFGSGC